MNLAGAVCILVSAVATPAGRPAIRLSDDGIITYTGKDGRPANIRLGKKCADLWVSPNESIAAFIAIENARSAVSQDPAEEDAVYIARKSDGYAPIRLVTEVSISGQAWRVFRQPSVSPDLKQLYFSVPYTMTSWKLMSTSIPPSSFEPIDDADSYCVVWGGPHSGELLMEIRREADSRERGKGVSYPCYLRSKTGMLTKAGDENECWAFGKFAANWSTKHGGTCRPADLKGR